MTRMQFCCVRCCRRAERCSISSRGYKTKNRKIHNIPESVSQNIFLIPVNNWRMALDPQIGSHCSLGLEQHLRLFVRFIVSKLKNVTVNQNFFLIYSFQLELHRNQPVCWGRREASEACVWYTGMCVVKILTISLFTPIHYLSNNIMSII